MSSQPDVLEPIGWVESTITDVGTAPKQGDEHDATAWVHIHPHLAAALDGVRVGDRMILLTWLHLARRDVLTVHPRGDQARAPAGVFATRSPDRPNPIGIHDVTIVDRRGSSLLVTGLEAVDGTPVVDLKPVLGPVGER